jgi:hypothetical protein
MKKIDSRVLVFCLFIAIVSTFYFVSGEGESSSRVERKVNLEMITKAGELVKVTVIPKHSYSFDIMNVGVFQHLDRIYTYDVIPNELLGGLLFQGIHRPPAGTEIEFELLNDAIVYFFFHNEFDGGYGEIFQHLDDWELASNHPQYDIHNGDHGLKMIMYKLEATAGTYQIPATTKDKACFNIVFQPK